MAYFKLVNIYNFFFYWKYKQLDKIGNYVLIIKNSIYYVNLITKQKNTFCELFTMMPVVETLKQNIYKL